MRKIISATAGLALLAAVSGCGSISASLPNDLLGGSNIGSNTGAKIVTDAKDTEYNLTQAMAVGALPATDPAAGCVTAINAAVGLNGPPPISFEPKIGGIASLGSVAYIRAQQLQALTGSVVVPTQCYAVLGKMQVDALRAAIKAAPMGGLALPF